MRHLSDTITRLTAFRSMKQAIGVAPTSVRLVELREFGTNPGALTAKIYVPDGMAIGAPLVVVLHGCTQIAEGYDVGAGWTRMAEQQGFAVLFPEQQRANNPNLCFNWFVPEDSRRNSGEALSISQMIATVVSRYKLDDSRVFINGLSAGGAMTAVMLATYPEIFAGGAIIAGLPYGIATTVPEAFDRMRGHGLPAASDLQGLVQKASGHAGPWPTISVWHGADDRTVVPANADAIVTQWRGVHDLPAAPSSIERTQNCSKRTWTGSDGRAFIEEYRIAGMGHGTPIAAGNAAGDGKPGPFMLDVGISSTKALCEAWHLERAVDTIHARPGYSVTQSRAATKTDQPKQSPRPGVSDGSMEGSGIKGIIEKALKSAGLMR